MRDQSTNRPIKVGERGLVAYCRGSSTGGVLLWVLAILTMDSTGEDHQQEKGGETKN